MTPETTDSVLHNVYHSVKSAVSLHKAVGLFVYCVDRRIPQVPHSLPAARSTVTTQNEAAADSSGSASWWWPHVRAMTAWPTPFILSLGDHWPLTSGNDWRCPMMPCRYDEVLCTVVTVPPACENNDMHRKFATLFPAQCIYRYFFLQYNNIYKCFFDNWL